MLLCELFSQFEAILDPADAKFITKVVTGKAKIENLHDSILSKIVQIVSNLDQSARSELYAINKGVHDKYDTEQEWAKDWLQRQSPGFINKFWLPRNTRTIQ